MNYLYINIYCNNYFCVNFSLLADFVDAWGGRLIRFLRHFSPARAQVLASSRPRLVGEVKLLDLLLRSRSMERRLVTKTTTRINQKLRDDFIKSN
jgi:hypothetical protein